jgi:alkyl sulfatase BDS1-like metallo-beta-lactamase superfamily hydrolase
MRQLNHLAFILAISMATPLAHAVEPSNLVAPKDATTITKQINNAFLTELPFSDKQDFEDAKRGFIAALPEGNVKLPDGTMVWDLNKYAFLKDDKVPDTVNPSLWRIAQLNMNNGLFKVVDRIYQIRGFDLSNMTIVEGDTGIIVIDPLISKEVAQAGLELYYANRPKKPVVAVLYTHSHVDHYGGVKGIVSEDDVNAGKVKIIAPAGFLEEAISENVYAGNAMGRRAQYQYGAFLMPGPRGQIDAGLGKNTSLGDVTLIPPTVTIETSGQKLNIDGIDMEFQMAPGTEAPSEMLVYLPQFNALCAAEDLTHTLHNLYTLRGAQVRDANKWWKAINTAIENYGDKVQVVFAQHHWPKWDNKNIVPYMEKQRDQFKYLHDQSLRLMNQGYTMVEVAEAIDVPEPVSHQWYNRGYYGSVNHDSKAVYQKYLGWYNSNPADLHPLVPVEAAKKYVEYMGGIDAVIKLAKASYDKGEYRWVAEVMKHAVFADPSNKQARELQADAFEQLGYQQENPTWRNEYLMGAFELRNGVPQTSIDVASQDTVMAMPVDMVLDYMGLRLNGPKAKDVSTSFNMKFLDKQQQNYAARLEYGVLIYTPDKQYKTADVTVSWPKSSMLGILSGATNVDKEIAAGRITIVGDKAKLQQLFDLQDNFQSQFNIVTP